MLGHVKVSFALQGSAEYYDISAGARNRGWGDSPRSRQGSLLETLPRSAPDPTVV